MRATPILGVAIVAVLLSACGRPAAERASGYERFDPFPQSNTAAVPAKTPGQARLAPLVANQAAERAAPPPPASAPPMATYSRYDGRGPGDAAIPDDVSVARKGDRVVVPTRNQAVRDTPGRDDAPSRAASPPRDVVDLGLSRRNAAERARRVAARDAAPTLVRAPAPLPRPIAQTPRPQVRPTVASAEASATPPAPAAEPQREEVALPPQPRIAPLSTPSLGVPRVVADATPTALPSPDNVEVAVPLGKIPATLGVANLKAAEAALPVPGRLEKSSADESGAIGWEEAAALIRAGEVENYVDIGQFELLLTLCSGRGVIAIQPTPNALADLEVPKVICGKAASLTSQ